MNLFRRKNVADLQAEALADHSLKRALGPLNLTTLGIGAIVGAGIFVLTGTAAARHAGPAVVLSFVLAGIASGFAALCYSEFASLVPKAGSAYTYGYATLGELFAWIIGWDLVLEYAVGAIAVAVSWSGYVVSFLRDFGIYIPPELSAAHGTRLIDLPASIAPALKLSVGWQTVSDHLLQQIKDLNVDPASLPQAVSIINLPAILIIAVVTTLLVIGIKESARFNNVIVMIKLGVVLLFIVAAVHAINFVNWTHFVPPNRGDWGDLGWSGVMRGASLVFFAYIGFDAVSTAAQEAKNPKRDMPIGIIGSLLICTVLYILVSGIATGVVPYQELDVPDPIAKAADRAGLGWMAGVVKFGAIAGLSSVVLVMMLGQTRVLWAMSKDGLLPPFIRQVHPKFQTPWITTILTGILVTLVAAFITVPEAGELCNIGTLLAFVIVSIGVVVLRVRHPDLPRTFKTPAVWVVGPMGAISSLALMVSLPRLTWLRLLGWLAVGLVIYFTYSIRKSALAQSANSANVPAERLPGQ